MKRTFNKLNIQLLVLLLSAAGISGCRKYLDLKPMSRLDDAYVFSNVQGAQSAVMGVYSQLTIFQNGPIRFFPYTADDVAANFAGALDNAMRSIHRYDLRPTNTQLAGTFDGLYTGIDRANVCIKQIPAMAMYTSGSAEQVAALQRLLGEALTLRALYYFELLRNWGDVPASFVPANEQQDLFLEKTDRQVIYDRIIADLAEAVELLPWRNDPGVQNDERITKGGAKALRARIALFAGGYSLRKNRQMERPANYLAYYTIANEECRSLLERKDKHDLNPSFGNLFKSLTSYKPDPHGEVMLEIGFSVNNTGMLGYFDGPRYTFPGMDRQGGGSQVYLLPTLFYAFDQQDLRRDVTAAPYETDFVNMARKGRPLSILATGKFRIDWTAPLLNSATLFTGINWPVIRFSDVLLMYAETENELNGPTPAAINAFEAVRKRGFGGNAAAIGVTPADKEGFFNAIVKERLLEFAGEGIRKYDLVRWNLLAEKLEETRTALTNMKDRKPPYDTLPLVMRYKNGSFDLVWESSYYSPTPPGGTPPGYTVVGWMSAINTAVVSSYAPFFEANKNELLPIPQSAVDANPRLTQDFGY